MFFTAAKQSHHASSSTSRGFRASTRQGLAACGSAGVGPKPPRPSQTDKAAREPVVEMPKSESVWCAGELSLFPFISRISYCREVISLKLGQRRILSAAHCTNVHQKRFTSETIDKDHRLLNSFGLTRYSGIYGE